MTIKQNSESEYIIKLETEEDRNRFKEFFCPAKYLTATEVMNILDISRSSLCNYVKQGKIKVELDCSGKQYKYDADSVYALNKKPTAGIIECDVSEMSKDEVKQMLKDVKEFLDN